MPQVFVEFNGVGLHLANRVMRGRCGNQQYVDRRPHFLGGLLQSYQLGFRLAIVGSTKCLTTFENALHGFDDFFWLLVKEVADGGVAPSHQSTAVEHGCSFGQWAVVHPDWLTAKAFHVFDGTAESGLRPRVTKEFQLVGNAKSKGCRKRRVF